MINFLVLLGRTIKWMAKHGARRMKTKALRKRNKIWRKEVWTNVSTMYLVHTGNTGEEGIANECRLVMRFAREATHLCRFSGISSLIFYSSLRNKLFTAHKSKTVRDTQECRSESPKSPCKSPIVSTEWCKDTFWHTVRPSALNATTCIVSRPYD